jgi:uncharacterized protein YjeT (DUF2065 family)
MDITWSDLGAALALVLVIEGILPFLSPRQAKQTYLMAAHMRDQPLRTVGLISMLIGLALLYLVR